MAKRQRKLTYAHTAPAPVAKAVQHLGANIATARLRRRWRQEDLAQKAGITRLTLIAVEQGKLGTGVGAYVAALWALGLEDEIGRIAAPDKDPEGIALETSRLGERVHPPQSLNDDF